VNGKTARYNADGSVTLVAAPRDIGLGNWLDTGGHREGQAMFRALGTDSVPHVECRVVDLT
jgi:hypothetical protein